MTLALAGHWLALALTGHGLTWLAFARHRLTFAGRHLAWHRLIQPRGDFQSFADRLVGDLLLAGDFRRAFAGHLLSVGELLLRLLQGLGRGDLLL